MRRIVTTIGAAATFAGMTLLLLGAASASRAADFTVTGTIRTPTGGNVLANNVNVRWIRVHVMDEDGAVDQLQGTGQTDASGNFSIAFTDDTADVPDIYIDVEYIGTAIDNRLITVRVGCADADPIRDVNIEGMVHNNIAAGTTALGVLRTQSTRANIVSQIGDALRNLEGQFNWTMPGNMNVEGRAPDAGGSFVSGDGQCVSIAENDYNTPGSGNAAFSDMHHESFHWVAYRGYGNRWPVTLPACSPPSHSSNLESCEDFAMQEGSAQWFGSFSAVLDQKSGPPAATVWRGADGTGSDNSGEIVEGALELTWNQIADVPGALRVLLTDAPDSMKEFTDAYIIDKGATNAATVTYLNAAAKYGIVHTRGSITGFTPGNPPNVAPADPTIGNFKIIDSKAFARGKVKATVGELTRPQIPLAVNSAVIAADQKDLGHKQAAAGVTDQTTAGFTFIGAVPIANDLEWDTSGLPDDDKDVLIKLRNINTRQDDFNPDFTGDSNALTNSDEEWLKTKRTWYNQDATPTTDDEGKVILDNTEPTVENFKPQ